VDLAKFQPVAPANTVANRGAESVASLSANRQLGSDPPGADIDVDGSFAGDTPSDVQIAEGEHTVALKKAGVKDWERKLKVTSGSRVHLNAELRDTSKSVAKHGNQSPSLCPAGQPRRLSPHERFYRQREIMGRTKNGSTVVLP
jgi:hypothetical protein